MIDAKLIEKYNQAVPRYTSYPPANLFHDNFSAHDFEELIISSNHDSPSNISFYVHIPFCKKLCFYCGCNACAIQNSKKVKEYIDALKTEIGLITKQLDASRKVSQIHFGGGTPNSIPVDFLVEIKNLLLANFTTIENPEIAIECNPAYLDYEYINELLKAGFNRFSLGIQDFDNNVLKTVNRDPSSLAVENIIEQIKKHHKNNAVNLDFIYGLPLQTPSSIIATLNKAIELKPDRLVTFSYAHVPWIKQNQKILEKRGLPTPNEKMTMFLEGYNLLKNAGYVPLGLDHFVLPEDELNVALSKNLLHRNFQGYCTKRTTGQVYAFGISAISQLSDGYAQNTKNIDDYISSLKDNKLPIVKGYKTSRKEKIIRSVINEIMCNLSIEWEKIADEFNITVNEIKHYLNMDKSVLSEFEKDEILSLTDEKIKISEKGAFFVRNIAASLDPAFKSLQNQYSKTV